MRLTVLLFALVACASKSEEYTVLPPDDFVKIYSIQPTPEACPYMVSSNQYKDIWCDGKSGLYHFRSRTVVPFEKAKNWIALEPADFSKIMKSCPVDKD